MKKLDSRYIIGALLIIFILRGIVTFLINGNQVLTLSSIYYEFPLGLVVLEEVPIGKGWKKFRYFLFVFLSFYIPVKIADFLGVDKLTLTIMPYFIILGILFILLIVSLVIKLKKFLLHL